MPQTIDRIVALGCSNTWGMGLPDIEDEDFVGKVPSKLAWPVLVGNKLNLKRKIGEHIINYGSVACSNKFIHRKLTSLTNLKKTDLVLILWTYHDRHCVFKNETEELARIRPWHDDKPTKNYYKYHHSQYDAELATAVFMDHSAFWLRNKKIKYRFATVFDGWKYNHSPYLNYKESYIDINFTKVHNNYIGKKMTAKDNIHPGVDMHRYVADQFYQSL